MSDEKLETMRITGIFSDALQVTREDGRVGDLTQTREGQPLRPGEELVQICGSDEPGTIKLRTLYKHGKGPAKVSTPSYREGYDAVFGCKVKAGDLN